MLVLFKFLCRQRPLVNSVLFCSRLLAFLIEPFNFVEGYLALGKDETSFSLRSL